MTTEAPATERINRKTWSEPSTVDWFRNLEGWTDPGERAALACVAAEAQGEPILDLGVGGGRTVPLLRAISRDYVAIDYTPELVVACRQKYPDARVMHGDARDLSRFADGSFKLVVFSFNGIDAVTHAGRTLILREAHRVLRSGGVFLFSAHNHEGPGNGEKLSFGVYFTRNPFKLAARVARAALHVVGTIRNHLRYSKLDYEGEGYSIKNAAAHGHGIMMHYTSLERQRWDLEHAGFRPSPTVFGNLNGRRIAVGDDVSDEWWFHFVARK